MNLRPYSLSVSALPEEILSGRCPNHARRPARYLLTKTFQLINFPVVSKSLLRYELFLLQRYKRDDGCAGIRICALKKWKWSVSVVTGPDGRRWKLLVKALLKIVRLLALKQHIDFC